MIDKTLVEWLYLSYFGIFKNPNPFPDILTNLVVSTKKYNIEYGDQLSKYLNK